MGNPPKSREKPTIWRARIIEESETSGEKIPEVPATATQPGTEAAGMSRKRSSGAAQDEDLNVEREGLRRQIDTVKKPKVVETSDPALQNSMCQVPGCGIGLSESLKRKVRICNKHRQALVLEMDGFQGRFCQQCSRVHNIEAFDGNRRGCRDRLRRRVERLRETNEMQDNTGMHEYAGQPGAGQYGRTETDMQRDMFHQQGWVYPGMDPRSGLARFPSTAAQAQYPYSDDPISYGYDSYGMPISGAYMEAYGYGPPQGMFRRGNHPDVEDRFHEEEAVRMARVPSGHSRLPLRYFEQIYPNSLGMHNDSQSLPPATADYMPRRRLPSGFWPPGEAESLSYHDLYRGYSLAHRPPPHEAHFAYAREAGNPHGAEEYDIYNRASMSRRSSTETAPGIVHARLPSSPARRHNAEFTRYHHYAPY